MDRVELSVVIPVYGCCGSLVALHDRLTRTLQALGRSYEIVFVDDRGPDGSWTVLRELAADDPRVVAIRMSRNVGQQLAITAGLAECRGAHAVVMDCDLQDPPEVIPRLLAEAERGAGIVFARRKSDHQSGARLMANRLYFGLLGLVGGRHYDGELGAFSLISRPVIDAFLLYRERDRHYLMILHDLGFDAATMDYERSTREVGQSGYSLRRLLAHALSGLFFTTTRLLHWVIYAGLGMAVLGALLAAVVIVQWTARGAAPGWTSLIVVQLLVGGVVTLCVGVTGLYVGKIFEASQDRPLYVVQDRIGGASRVGRPLAARVPAE